MREEQDKLDAGWDIHGWKHLTVHDDPPLVAARTEFLTWLDEIPEPHRTDLSRRLKGKIDHPHFSARLELFMHHYFAANGWPIQIHPDVPDTENHPDFLVEYENNQFLVECRSVMDQQPVAQQDQRLRQLADEITQKLSVPAMLQPLEDLPPNLPATQIRHEISRRIHKDSEIQEIDIKGEHQNTRYGLRAIVFNSAPNNDLPLGVEGVISQIQTVTVGQRVREAIQEKAGKYGELHLPFLVAVSVETNLPARTKHELEALFGDKVWNLRPNHKFSDTRKPNGLFTMTHDGSPRYARVSGVLFYRLKWRKNSHQHRMYIYHNPCASIPIDSELFPKILQFVLQDDSRMEWINGKPDTC